MGWIHRWKMMLEGRPFRQSPPLMHRQVCFPFPFPHVKDEEGFSPPPFHSAVNATYPRLVVCEGVAPRAVLSGSQIKQYLRLQSNQFLQISLSLLFLPLVVFPFYFLLSKQVDYNSVGALMQLLHLLNAGWQTEVGSRCACVRACLFVRVRVCV